MSAADRRIGFRKAICPKCHARVLVHWPTPKRDSPARRCPFCKQEQVEMVPAPVPLDRFLSKSYAGQFLRADRGLSDS